ncbi:hypothetical protein [Streptomyces diacarni]|uniref:hypothetical protein n=1 Tax=Streptomyces diacarni TaxID=2800381 RepID=UPI0015F0E99D
MISVDSRFVGTAEVVDVPSVAVVVDVTPSPVTPGPPQGAESVLAESLDEGLASKAAHPDRVALKDGPRPCVIPSLTDAASI